MGSEILPTGVLVITDFIFLEIRFSFIHPISPPRVELSDKLELIATLSKPSI